MIHILKYYLNLMSFRRRNNGCWTKESSAKAHAAKARKRMTAPPLNEPRRIPEGELLEILDLRSSCGKMRRWIIRQGPRANNIIVESQGKRVVCGWDHLMTSLRKHLSVPKRARDPYVTLD